MEPSFSPETKFAIDTALDAGKILMDHWGKSHELDYHQKNNFKIEVDNLSNRLIQDRVTKRFPRYGFYSEESEEIKGTSELKWVIDPLDGTIPYTRGTTDHFSVCIALIKERTPILGVSFAPKRREIYVAEQGLGAFCNGRRTKTSQEQDINRVVIGLDDGKTDRSRVVPYFERLIHSSLGVTAIMRSACASVPINLTASGRMDAYLATSLAPEDMAAGVIINRESGAKVTNLKNQDWSITDRSILIANPSLHARLYSYLNQ